MRWTMMVLLIVGGCKKKSSEPAASPPATGEATAAPGEVLDEAWLQEFVVGCAEGCGATADCSAYCVCLGDHFLRGRTLEEAAMVLHRVQTNDPAFQEEAQKACSN